MYTACDTLIEGMLEEVGHDYAVISTSSMKVRGKIHSSVASVLAQFINASVAAAVVHTVRTTKFVRVIVVAH